MIHRIALRNRLLEGSIEIDGIDICKIGLTTLRSAIAIIPQQPTLFSGTLRSNLDPFDQWDDARLLDAMRRSCLIGDQALEDGEGAKTERFTLDTPIEEEGLNLSVGQRSLVSLARAIVKDSKITLLDEGETGFGADNGMREKLKRGLNRTATSSVDLETDERIQQTIQREFRSHTLLCIAHRLRTILGWDRILVMSAGEIDEYGTPLELFDVDGGAFRGMCERSHISRHEIEKAQAQAAAFKASGVVAARR
jgi:ABC-type multidrug transport system fused ATPase/permease subunit